MAQEFPVRGGQVGSRWGAAVATVVVSVVGATGCATGPGSGAASADSARDRGEAVAPAPDELRRHGGVCPPRLPAASEGAQEVATAAPSLPVPAEAWMCVYAPVDGAPSEPGPPGWRLRGRAAAVPADAVGRLPALLDRLAPADVHRMCTDDLGPRLALTYTGAAERSGDLTTVVVDLFGCRDVQLTSDPFTTAPGDLGPQDGAGDTGVVGGVLTGPPELTELLQSVVPDLGR